MSTIDLKNKPVLVVGAGIMGAGIAQVAAQAGHPVFLFDLREGAAAEARAKLAATLDGLAAKGKLSLEVAQATLTRITAATSLQEAAGAGLVIEAIVEKLEAKRSLFREIEGIVEERTVLATNTSSISVTAIANGLKQPGRLVGMHFFNPVPLMKLVEVVSGLATVPDVAEAIFALSQAWGKVPVHAKSTPGFIVNRIARPYYAETLALLQEQAATPQALDACLKSAGFRMGPCELMDLIGHDTNFSVTQSVYEANFYDKRYAPSLVQREMVEGGLLGRKSGRGFYRYPEGAPPLPATTPTEPLTKRAVTVHGNGPVADALEAAATRALTDLGIVPARERGSTWVGLQVDGGRLVLTDGRPAQEVAKAMGTADLAVFDHPLHPTPGAALAYAVNASASAAWHASASTWLHALGFLPLKLQDVPGLVVSRTVAMLVNEAADAVQQGVCTSEGADEAMKLGVNYPMGPFQWLSVIGVHEVVAVLDALDACYRGERYRVSPYLRRLDALESDWESPCAS